MTKSTDSINATSPDEIPTDWRRTTLGQIGEYINGRGFKKSEWSDKGLPIIRIQNLTGTGNEQNYYSGEIDERHVVHPGDLLISWAATLGAYLWSGPQAALNQHIFKVRSFVDKKFHYYLMLHILADLYRQTHGSGMVHITKSKFDSMPIVIPDTVDGQKRIVEEIEKQFSRLDEAITNLKRVKANLKRYKAAVLKSAVEGRLVETEASIARREGRSYDTGEQLLQRILETRRSQWKGKGKYKEPAAPDTTDLPELPEGWAYATAEQLTDENRAITYGVIKLGEPIAGGVPVLRSSDVRQLRIDLVGVKRISPKIAGNYRRTLLKGGEVVMTVRGTLGGIAVVPAQCSGFNVSREVAMLALVNPAMAHLIALLIASAPLEGWLMHRTKGIAYTGINIETLKALPIPVPPIAEQHRIVAEVDRRLSLIREIEIQADANLKRSERLRQSILFAAFSGRLKDVSVDSLIEPTVRSRDAGVLL